MTGTIWCTFACHRDVHLLKKPNQDTEVYSVCAISGHLSQPQCMQDADRDMITWQYHAHARKAAYAISGDAVSVALLPNSDVLRMLQDEGWYQHPVPCSRKPALLPHGIPCN